MVEFEDRIKDLDAASIALVVERMYKFMKKWTDLNYSDLSLNNNEERATKCEEWQQDLTSIGDGL